MKTYDFTIGIITGVVLTFLGVIIQFQLNKEHERNRERNKLDIVTVRQLDNRLQRSNSILLTSNSSVFNDRWNNYIYDVFYPWNSNLYILDVHMQQNHKSLYKEFNDVCVEFREVHSDLLEIRKLQNPISTHAKKMLKEKENQTKEKLDNLSIKIDSIKKELSDHL